MCPRRVHPTRAWVQTALFLGQADETFSRLGVQLEGTRLGLPRANEWKASVVQKETIGVASLFESNHVQWVKGSGTFRDAHTITLQGFDDSGSELSVQYGDGETLKADLMLVSVGRGPRVEGLGLENAGVEFDRRKGIVTNNHRRTTVKHIYAVSDYAGHW